jgi:putative restriction endonuclease
MKLYVGGTHNDWYRFLRSRPELDEVNFWQPGATHLFKGLQPGELFLFKLHVPENFIAGGGFFTHASLLPVSLAWEAYRLANALSALYPRLSEGKSCLAGREKPRGSQINAKPTWRK